MAKDHKRHSHRKRHYKKHGQIREVHAENYFKRQTNTINSLKPVVTAGKRLSERAAQAARDSRNAARDEAGKAGTE